MFKRASILVVLFVFMVLNVSAAQWNIDKAHSSVGFTVKHLVISKVKGSFTSFSGNINFDSKDFTKSSVEMKVMVNSVDTDDKKRDDHLRSPDFFDVEKFPEMSFKSTKVIKGEGDSFQIVGNLTIKDVTKEVTFDCEFNGTVAFMGTNKAGFSAKTTINRQDFGVKWSKTLDTGSLVVGNDVEIYLEIEADQAG